MLYSGFVKCQLAKTPYVMFSTKQFKQNFLCLADLYIIELCMWLYYKSVGRCLVIFLCINSHVWMEIIVCKQCWAILQPLSSICVYQHFTQYNAVCDCLSGTDQINRSSGAQNRNVITLQPQMLNSLSLWLSTHYTDILLFFLTYVIFFIFSIFSSLFSPP